ncbi:Tfp pilus assembly protein FimV-like protein [Methylovorus glucosotrophus SIP3-4]|uniref:Tfp pilus assembly protein FimV-like protein n=2 Tax=Methylovorus glucosotrophus TaxID=266009 RepID=C6X9S7_METGS|nr:Tfp pilus assembly protein FimV-like protein [Methylovorus glucosotrophus SIP3-4]
MQHDEIATIIKKFNDANMPPINSLARRSGFKALSLILLLVLVPVLAFGAGLGRINVKSTLGEPLNADIELLEMPAKEAATLVARIGNNDEYLTAGLQDAIVPPGVRVTSVARPDGTHVLHVTTPRAVNEPFLELLIKVDSDNLHMVRQYTVLLDPPTSKMGDEPVVVNTIPELQSQGLVAEVPPPFPIKSKSRKSRSGGNGAHAFDTSKAAIPLSADTYLTQPGDIFGKVAQQYQPAGVPLKKVMAALYAANPEAFLDGDINQLKSGQVLKIPSPEALGGALPNKAKPAVVEVPPPAAPKSADAPANPEFVLKISPGDTSDAADKDGQTGEPTADANAEAKGQGTQATSTPAPVAPAPAVAQAAPPAPSLATVANQGQPGFWDTVLDRLVWIGLGLLLGLVSLGMVYYLHMRRLTAMQNWHESMVQTTAPRHHPNDVEPKVVSAPPPVMPVEPAVAAIMAPAIAAAVAEDKPEASSSTAPLQPGSEQEADFDIHEVDPIVEAEIYISYGRDEQAENILLNALEKTPDRHELTLCLLKIYAERQDAIAFDNLALRLQQAAENGEPGTLEQWHTAAVMGHRLSPHNPLYIVEGLTDQTPAPEPEEDTLMLPELGPIVEEPPVLPEFEPLKPLAETNILEFTFEKIPAEGAQKKPEEVEEHDTHATLFPSEKK